MAGSAVQINLIERLVSSVARLLNEMKTESSDRLRQKMKNIIEPRIRSIISEYSLPTEMESLIKDAVKEKLEDNEDLTVENMFSIISLNLPDSLVNKIKHSLFVNKLQKVSSYIKKNSSMYFTILECTCIVVTHLYHFILFHFLTCMYT